MRKGPQFLSVALLAALLGGWVISRHLSARHEARIAVLQADWNTTRGELERQLEEARAHSHTEGTPAPNPRQLGAPPTAQEWLDRILAHVSQNQHGPDARRRLTWLFESLIATGPAAVPPVRDFLARGGDAPLGDRGDLPLSLRLAFIDSLRRIGGPAAIAALAELIPQTTKVWDLVAISEALTGAQHRDHVPGLVAAAHRLLALEAGQDQNSRARLYRLLAELGDHSLVQQARENLVLANGRIDEVAMNYLSRALGESAVPDLVQALQSGRLTERSDRQSVMASLALHVGKNPQAAEEFSRALQDASVPAEVRFWAIGQLNNWSPHMSPPGGLAMVIGERQALIDRLLPVINDESAVRELRRMRGDLDQMLRERRE